jgi:hypothetical protein
MGKKSIYTEEERIENKRKYNRERRLRKLDEFNEAHKRWVENHPDFFKTEEYRQKRKSYPSYGKRVTKRIRKRKPKALEDRINKKSQFNSIKEYQRAWRKDKLNTDKKFALACNIRTLISISFKKKHGFTKKNKTEDILGCTIKFLIEYLLTYYPDNSLTHEDFGRYGYHIDHIIPVASAKTEEEVIKLNHYTNLRPLWWKDNLKKSNKFLN